MKQRFPPLDDEGDPQCEYCGHYDFGPCGDGTLLCNRCDSEWKRPTPVRLQRRRTKGFRLVSPNGLPVVCVTRPGKWGNQFKVCEGRNRGEAVQAFRSWIENCEPGRQFAIIVRRELAGKNLACYCKPGESCHADVLLEIANTPTQEPLK